MEAEKAFKRELVAWERTRTLLLRLRLAIGRPIDWSALLASDGVTCDVRGQPLPSCGPAEGMRPLVESSLNYFAAVGCEDRALTWSVIGLAVNPSDARWSPLFRANLASRLLSKGCRAVTTIPDEEWLDPGGGDAKETLRGLVAKTNTQAWTPQCRTMDLSTKQTIADVWNRAWAQSQKPVRDGSPAQYMRLLIEANELLLLAVCRTPDVEAALSQCVVPDGYRSRLLAESVSRVRANHDHKGSRVARRDHQARCRASNPRRDDHRPSPARVGMARGRRDPRRSERSERILDVYGLFGPVLKRSGRRNCRN
jgi:hypothetical protein